MNFKFLFLGLPLLTALSTSSCNVSVHDHSIEDGEACRGVCEPYCEYFVSCGAITTAEGLVLCEDSCRRSYDSDADATTESTACVEKQACRVAGESQCGGPVVPVVVVGGGYAGGTTGVGGSAAGGTTTGGGTAMGGGPASDGGLTGAGGGTGNVGGAAGAPPAGRCVQNRDCALSEDCVAGTCLARCNASCECRSDEQCDTGYCRPSTSAHVACQRDCDCPASQHCITGFCQ